MIKCLMEFLYIWLLHRNAKIILVTREIPISNTWNFCAKTYYVSLTEYINFGGESQSHGWLFCCSMHTAAIDENMNKIELDTCNKNVLYYRV